MRIIAESTAAARCPLRWTQLPTVLPAGEQLSDRGISQGWHATLKSHAITTCGLMLDRLNRQTDRSAVRFSDASAMLPY
jgi:hypothetical protein